MKTMKSAGLAVVMAASVLGFNSAGATEMILVVESCADTQCVVDSIDDEIQVEIEWSLDQQLQQMEAQFAEPMFASVEPKSHKSWQERFSSSNGAYSLRVN